MITENQVYYPKLRGRIVEKFNTITGFAGALGVERGVVSRKLTRKIEFTKADIEKWAEILEIPLEEIGIYFFEK